MHQLYIKFIFQYATSESMEYYLGTKSSGERTHCVIAGNIKAHES